MTESRPLPRAAEPFVRFSAVLRAHGFTVAPDQTIGFLQAIALLGPRSVEDIRRAGVAVLAIPKDRQEEFDALFRAHFLGVTAPGAADAEDETVPAHEPTGASDERDKVDADAEAGEQAAAIERLSRREFAEEGSDAALARFQRLAPARLPRRRSYRFAPDQRGRLLDMRRTLRDAARRDGEVFTLARRRRKDRQRKIVLLIDVSGSMKDRTEAAMTFAHALTGAADRAEVFTLGTRLTRLTPAFRVRNRARALERASALVADVDGGTRIGEALTTFLAVPRYAGFARGAAIVVLSDGLERGSPALMSEAVRRLSKLAWRLDWLTPLAADPDYVPATGGLSAIVPSIDALADGSTSEVVAGHVLSLASRARQGSAA
ncbi:MAG: VWA domain-containing protein [Boseongicola sp. SB0664_bin_43]|uniref:VWA domain-containing protein n=1 Tax=Boseongicola sp. SB0664_bin_43 TaxID=2604844 RepID=A0A6B0XZS8_9RHOB|nr:VWA domain-containing protein [Boseongicola sp. SB0664_bin_43]MYK30865.1 VWA domain-containing protein [Boseongicola sp. SB0670_bin_30]